jgi:hypothetical protein
MYVAAHTQMLDRYVLDPFPHLSLIRGAGLTSVLLGAVRCRCLLQITLLSSGRLMYTGPTEQLVPWFTSLGYAYDAELHGMASDWALDLVSLGFTKPQQDGDEAAAAAGEGSAVLQAADQQIGSSSSRISSPLGANSDAARSEHTSYYSATGSSSGQCGFGEAVAAASQQRMQVHAGSCMMTSKQELNEAAAAFLAQLQQTQPEWFSERSTLASVFVPAPATALPPLSASAGAAATRDAASTGVYVNRHTSTASEESAGASTQVTMFSDPVAMHAGAPVEPTQQSSSSERRHTLEVQQQRVRWWSEAGINGGAPAPPAGSRW